MIQDELFQWKHVFKLDPDKEISDDALEKLCMSGTDAIMLGGTTGVTFDNTVELMSRVRRYALPCVLEISDLDSIVPGFDLYFVPVVLNSRSAKWITGMHQQAVKTYGHRIPWELIVPEGYIILNEHCKAANVTECWTGLDAEDAKAYAKLGEQMFRIPVIYIEYSGTFGDMQLLRKTYNALENATLFYGGGIDSKNKAVEALQAADTIIVGNVIYDDLTAALETVEAVK